MKRILQIFLCVSAFFGSSYLARGESERPALFFDFDQVRSTPTERNRKGETVEVIHETVFGRDKRMCQIGGYHDLVDGVRGKALMFDGYTTRITVPQKVAVDVKEGLTVQAWVTENGLWMGDQSIENFNGTEGCIEHMLDPHCRFSHVRIIESTPARAVVHWRYCPVAANGSHSQVDPKTGWADWVDEYYYFYPDQVGMRHVVLRTQGRFLWPEEVIGLCHPGQRPEDVVELSALKLVNLKGKSHTYTLKPTWCCLSRCNRASR